MRFYGKEFDYYGKNKIISGFKRVLCCLSCPDLKLIESLVTYVLIEVSYSKFVFGQVLDLTKLYNCVDYGYIKENLVLQVRKFPKKVEIKEHKVFTYSEFIKFRHHFEYEIISFSVSIFFNIITFQMINSKSFY